MLVGAASDKVAALEKAGVMVTDSPAKIGSTMLKVCCSVTSPGNPTDTAFSQTKDGMGNPNRAPSFPSERVLPRLRPCSPE